VLPFYGEIKVFNKDLTSKTKAKDLTFQTKDKNLTHKWPKQM